MILVGCVSAIGDRLLTLHIYTGTAYEVAVCMERVAFTPSTELESSTTQSILFYSIPIPNRHLLANFALYHRLPPLKSQIRHLTAVAQAPPTSLDSSHNLIKDLSTAAQKIEADLHVAKAELHQALAREKLIHEKPASTVD